MPHNLRILFTMTPQFDPNSGGVQRTTYKLGKYFTEQGLEVAYFSFEINGHIACEFGTLFTVKEAGSCHNRANIARLEMVLKDWKPTIVINQMPYEKPLRECLNRSKNEGGYILLGCLRNSLFNFKSNAREILERTIPSLLFKLMDHSLGIGLVKWRHKLKHSRELKLIIDQHDKFILLAPPNRAELQYFIGAYKAYKVDAIPNSIPEVQEEVPQKKKIILHVGRLNIPQKRSDLLLDFWRSAQPQIPDWEFVIVGDGPYLETIEHQIKENQIPNVRLEGFRQPEPFYKEAAVFMMPSAYEGFPNTIIEAQSFGCLPLAFDSYAALGWIVNHNKDALLSQPFNTRKMALQVVDIANQPAKLTQMQQAALDNARRFTIDQVGVLWHDYFKKLMSGNAG